MKSVALLCFFAVFCAVAGMVLKEINPKFSALFSLATGLLFLLPAWRYLSPVVEYASSLGEGEDGSLFETLYKSLGMAVLVSVTADLCRDMGEKTAAEKVEFCGKAALAAMALPLFKEILSLLRGLI